MFLKFINDKIITRIFVFKSLFANILKNSTKIINFTAY